MKAFKVFWKGNIAEPPQEYTGSAIVVADDLHGALAIGASYGEVSSIHSESDVVIAEPKPGPILVTAER